jgi:hypothetical protein
VNPEQANDGMRNICKEREEGRDASPRVDQLPKRSGEALCP